MNSSNAFPESSPINFAVGLGHRGIPHPYNRADDIDNGGSEDTPSTNGAQDSLEINSSAPQRNNTSTPRHYRRKRICIEETWDVVLLKSVIATTSHIEEHGSCQ